VKKQKYPVDIDLRNCLKKQVFNTLEHAEVVARKNNQRIYKCLKCKKFHLTSRKFKPVKWEAIREKL